MGNKTVKLVVIKTYPQLQHILKEGDIVHLENVLYDKDTIICRAWYLCKMINLPLNGVTYGFYILDENNKPILLSKEVIAKKGSVEKTLIVLSNGMKYNSSIIYSALGPNSFKKVFKKIN